ncbi:MAG: trehalose-phosphatase [Acidiferrobacteraceae bacterium]
MRLLDHQIDLRAFFDRLSETSARTLFLDYDGTLAPFAVDPREASLYPCVIPILQRLIDGQHTRVVFVSGRRIEDLTPLLPFTPLPELWGAHGYEQMRPDGTRRVFSPGPESRDCLARVHQALSTGPVQTRCEVKTASIAVHWRGAPPEQVAHIRREITGIWQQISHRGGVTMDEFDGGIEFKARDRTKGSAVAEALGDSTIAAYLGDDLTDEDAFPVVSRIGLAVLVRPRLRPTSAALWLSPPDELEAFLLDWETACTGRSAGYLAALTSDETLEGLPWT